MTNNENMHAEHTEHWRAAYIGRTILIGFPTPGMRAVGFVTKVR